MAGVMPACPGHKLKSILRKFTGNKHYNIKIKSGYFNMQNPISDFSQELFGFMPVPVQHHKE